MMFSNAQVYNTGLSNDWRNSKCTGMQQNDGVLLESRDDAAVILSVTASGMDRRLYRTAMQTQWHGRPW